MALPQPEVEFLDRRGEPYSVTDEGNMTCVVLAGFALPPGLTPAHADLLLRLSPGFPDVPPDMWWFSPDVLRNDGLAIPATEHHEPHLGRMWQRWSRHLAPGQWRSGIDDLQTFLAIVNAEVRKAAPKEVVA